MAMSTKLKKVGTGATTWHDGGILGKNTPECTISALIFAFSLFADVQFSLQQQKLWERVDNHTGVRCESWICVPGPAFRISWGKKG